MKQSRLNMTNCLLGGAIGFGLLAISDLLIAPDYSSLIDRDLILFNIAIIGFVSFLFVMAIDLIKSDVWLYKVWLYALAVAATALFIIASPLLVTFWRTFEILKLAMVVAVLIIPILVHFYFYRRQAAFMRIDHAIRKWPRILTSATLLLSVPVVLVIFFGLSLLGVVHQISGDRTERNSVENNHYIVTQYYYLGFGVTTTGWTKVVSIDKEKWPRVEQELYSSDWSFDNMQLSFLSDSQVCISPRPGGDTTIVSLHGR